MTAGDLIRQAIADGQTALGLAKLIAGSSDDKNPEVQRLRFVVQRAADGGEPKVLNARQIGEFFGQKVDRPQRQRGGASGPQAELAAEVLRLTEKVDNLGARVERLTDQVERLTERVELLERRLPPGSQGEAGSSTT